MKFERLGNIAEIIAGQSPPSSSYNKDGKGIPFFQGKADYGIVNPVVRNWCTEPTKVSLPGDILISVRAPVGPVNLNNVEACIGRGLSAIRVKENVDRDYLFSFLKASEEKISSLGVGSTFKAITQKDLKELIIPVPTLPTQRHIANILSKAENLIAQRKESIALLDEFLKSTFLEMFGDPARNEKGWEKDKVISYTDCIVPGRDKPKSFSGNTPWFTTEDLVHKGYVVKSKKGLGLSDEEINEVRARVIPTGSVLMTCVGDLGILSVCKEKCVVNQQLHAFICNKEMNNLFLMYSLSFQSQFMYRKATSTTVPYMNKTTCNSIPVIKPPIKLQTQFAQIVEKTEALKIQYQQSLQELENLYGSLSQRAFRGELQLDDMDDGLLMVAGPESQNQGQGQLSIPPNKKGFAKLVLAGKIINECKDSPEFTNIKFQKLQHLAEHLMEADLNLNYYNQAAGPYDNKFMHTLHNKMKQQKWFASIGYKYSPLEKVNEIDGHFSRYFGTDNEQFSRLIKLLGKASEDQCEIISTLYAAWNDRIIKKEPITDEAIIQDFFNWSERKQRYNSKQLTKALEWMKKNDLEPRGFGKLIKHSKKTKRQV